MCSKNIGLDINFSIIVATRNENLKAGNIFFIGLLSI